MLRNRSKGPTIVVVGHLVKDEIISADGRMRISLGGIAYSLAALGAIHVKERVLPICAVGRDIESSIRDAFGYGSPFDFAGMRFSNRPNVVNRLIYNSDGSREEWNSRIAPPLDISGVDRRADAVLLNFISGHDVRLPELRAFRARYRGLIYCDYHSLALGHDKNRRRYYRLHPRWREYVGIADIVQMNLAELASICRTLLRDGVAIARACGRLHDAGARTVIITTGHEGVFLSESPAGRFYHVPAVAIRREVDPTGCGDMFSAAFLCQFLRTGNIVKSLQIANLYAAAKATFSGLDGFRRLERIVKSIGPLTKAIALKIPGWRP